MWKANIFLAASLTLAGCVISVDPIIPESAATFDARLLGTWEDVTGTDRAVVSRDGETDYAVVYTDSIFGSGRFQARLGRVGEHLFLDVWPALDDSDDARLPAGLFISGHMPFLLRFEGDEVWVSELDPDSLQSALRAGEIPLRYTNQSDRLVLLESSGALRSVLAGYLGQTGALNEPSVWRRTQ